MLYLFAQAVDKSADAAAKTGEAAKKIAEKAKEVAEPVAEKAADAADTVADAATSTEPSALEEFFNSGVLGYLIQGGPFMWILLLLAIIVLGVVIERFRSLKMLSTDTGQLRDDVLQLLRIDKVDEAMHRCDREQGPVPAVLSAGLRKFFVLRKLNYDPGRIEEQVVKAMDDYSVHIVAALEKHLPILATIASAAPMLGFLGTVQGMIVSFGDIEAMFDSGGGSNIVKVAASGISIALLTTCFGLIVGIPAYVAYNYFTGLINRFVLDVEEAGTELIEAVTLQLAVDEGESAQAAAPSPPGS